jgi:hypothetical protein
VRISREAAGLYPRAEFWFTETDDGQETEIRASIDVIQAPSDAFPYGKFNLYFSMLRSSVAIGGGNLLVTGTAAAPIAFTFYESGSHGGQVSAKAASVEMQADGSGLKAAVQSQSPWEGNSAWVVATNSTAVLANNKTLANAQAGSVGEVNLAGGTCLSTENFKYRVHGYGLYSEDTGAKIVLNTGVSCQYTDGSSKVRNCHISRNGAWFERESDGTEHSFANSDVVTRRAWGSDSAHDGEALSLFVSSGRLNKYTVKKYTLAEVRGVEMRLFDAGTEYIVKYLTIAGDGAASDSFFKVATMAWSEGGPPVKTDITPAAVSISGGEFKWFYADTMGGVSYVGGNSFVTARVEELVVPGAAQFSSGTFALKCLNRCPKGAITQGNLTSYAGPYETDPANKAGALDYLVNESDMTVHRGTSASDPAVALGSGVSFTNGTSVFNWGLESGAMVDSTAYTALTNLGDIYNTEGAVYYQYRMGPNNWDKLVLAKLGSTFLEFDNPLTFAYTHSTANDRNGDSTYNGKKFLLRYQGEGHIDGFPWDQVDRDGDGTPDMWFPQVSLKDDVQLNDGVTNYRIKALFGDLTLTPSGACGDLTLALPATSVPSEKQDSPANISKDKPDHGDCQYDSDSEAAAGCS